MEEVKGSIPFSSTPKPLLDGGFCASGLPAEIVWGVIRGVIGLPRETVEERVGVRLRSPKTAGERRTRTARGRSTRPRKTPGLLDSGRSRPRSPCVCLSRESSWSGPEGTPPSLSVISAGGPLRSPLLSP